MMRIKFQNYCISILISLSGSLLFGVTANFTASSGSADESDGGSFTVHLDGESFGSLSYVVGVGTANNSSVSNPDYTIQSATIYPAGDTLVTIDLGILNDTRYENDETIVITLSTGAGITAGDVDTFTFTITNDDNPPELTFTNSTSSQWENDQRWIQVDVDLSGTSTGLTATIDWAITNGTSSNTDHSSDLSGTLTFVEGDNTEYIQYIASHDIMDENDETFTIALSNNVNCSLGSVTSHTHTITDNDDPPNIGFSAISTTKGETDGTITITLDLDAASGKATSATVGIGGISTATSIEDYSNLSATTALSYSAGDQSESFTLDIENDELDEDSPETLVLYIAGTSDLSIDPTYDTLTINITDNDIEPTVSISAAVTGAESVTNPEITVSLDAVSGRIVTVNYADDASGTATAGTDYTTFAAQTLTNKTLTSPTITGTGSIAGTFTGDLTGTVLTTTQNSITTMTGLTAVGTSGTNTSFSGPIAANQTIITASDNLVVDPATQILEIKGDGSSVVGQIQLNCHNNNHGQKIKSQPHSESASNELMLPKGGNSTLVSEIAAQTLTNKTLTSPTITGTGSIAGIFTGDVTGNLDGIVGGTNPAAGTFTEITTTGNVTMTGKFLKQF